MAVAADLGAPVAPSLEQVRELAAEYNLMPLRHTFIADYETPVSAFLKLRGARAERAGLPARVGRPGPARRALLVHRRAPARGAALVAGRRRRPVRARRRGGRPLPPGAARRTLPPFAGGAVGFFGYDLVRTVEPLGEPNADVLGLPDMALMLTDVLVVFDHLKHTVTVARPRPTSATTCRASMRRRRPRSPRSRAALAGPGAAPSRRPAAPRPAPAFQSNMSREHVRGDGRADHRVHLRRRRLPGRALPALVGADRAVDAFSIYRGLRTINPSPYMYFLDFGDFQVAGASPEPLLTVTGRHVSTRPIAGTRPRGDERRGGPADRRRAARRREGARRARDARRPRPQRPRPRLRVRQRRRGHSSWRSRPTAT